MKRLSNELNNTAGLLYFPFSFLADVSGSDNKRDFGNATLSEDLGVSQSEEVKNGGSISLLSTDICITLLFRDEGPELLYQK